MAAVGTDDGANIHYEVDAGDGPWLTLLHGGLVASATWRLQRPELGRGIRNGRLVVIDHRGQGRSTAGDANLTIPRLAHDVLSVWDEVGIHNGVVVGFSMGGLVALELTRQAPGRVDGLVLESTPFGLTEEERDGFRDRAGQIRSGGIDADIAQQLVDRALSGPFRQRQPEITREYKDSIAARDPDSLADGFDAIAAWTYDGPAEPPTFAPLIIVGELDHAVGRPHAERARECFQDVELVELPQVGHTLHLESGPAFNHLVSEYARLRLQEPLYTDFTR